MRTKYNWYFMKYWIENLISFLVINVWAKKTLPTKPRQMRKFRREDCQQRIRLKWPNYNNNRLSSVIIIISPEVTEKGCTVAPPLLVMNIIISISCGPASPGYYNFHLENTKEEIQTEVFKHLQSFHGSQVILFIFSPEELPGCIVDWLCWDPQGVEQSKEQLH